MNLYFEKNVRKYIRCCPFSSNPSYESNSVWYFIAMPMNWRLNWGRHWRSCVIRELYFKINLQKTRKLRKTHDAIRVHASPQPGFLAINSLYPLFYIHSGQHTRAIFNFLATLDRRDASFSSPGQFSVR